MSKFLNKKYRKLEAYVPGEQPVDKKYIKLNTNESPYPASPHVIKTISQDEVAKLNLYPDPKCGKLKEKLAERYGFSEENIFVSNGSDDILNFAFMAFGEKGAIFPDISYGFYEVFGELSGIKCKKMALKEDFSIDKKDYFGAKKLVVIANPNAPTGMALPVKDIEDIVIKNRDSVVVVDEAYVDFGGESSLPLVKKYDNLLVVQTYSKSRSLAGGRLGFAIGDKELILDLEKIKYSTNPYSINRLTMLAGIAAIETDEYYMENCKEIAKTREFTMEELKKMGFSMTPSVANFIFVKKEGIAGETFYSKLREKGVLVRHFKKERIKDYVRVTIGTKEEMEKFLEITEEICLGGSLV